MRLVRNVLVLLLIAVLAGCASRSEIVTMKTQLEVIERSSGQMQEHIRDLDSLFRLTVERNVAYQADLKVALADMMDKMNVIDGRLTDMEKRMNQISQRGSVAYVPPPAQTQSPVDTAKTPSDQSTMPQVNPTKMFDAAFTDMKAGSFDLAILQFDEYLKQFPNSGLADDAQYWLAECYYSKKDYARAITEFEKIERQHPDSDKLTQAIYKLARSYQETGNIARARPIFERLVKDYPDSFEARQAEDRLKEML
jgi:tol-pal system protein YbgF